MILVAVLCTLAAAHGTALSSRIVDGSLQAIENVPWQVAIQSVSIGIPLCGGIILSENYVLTAASCVIGLDLGNAVVASGTDDLWSDKISSNISSFEVHPDYNSTDNNLAVIKLETKIAFDDTQKPAVLSDFEPLSNETVKFTGFGSTHQGFPGAPVAHELRTKNLTVWTDSACSEFLNDYSNKNVIICAGIFLRGPCFGDQGGPITENDQIIGVSVNRSCWQQNPALFVKIGPYRSFIDSASNGETTWA